MKQSEVQIGKVYQVKVSGVLKPVRIDQEIDNPWYKTKRKVFNGTVLTTGRKIRLTAGRMRKEIAPVLTASGSLGLTTKEGEE